MVSLLGAQTRIREQKLNWEAGSTEIGELMERRTFTGFGLHPTAKEPGGGVHGRMRRQSFAFTAPDLPARVDWRNVNGSDWTTQIRNQGQCGSCVAFATIAVIESRYRILKGDAYLSVDFSEAHLFFCGGPANGCVVGWQPGSALKYCRDMGVAAERDFPYRPQQMTCGPTHDGLQPAVRVTKWRRIGARNNSNEDRKAAIAERGPVIAGMNVYSDFGWYKGGVYRPTTTELLGRHAVAVVGYDDTLGCWIIKNSWGGGWGEGGWARIGYGSCGIDAQFDFYDPAVSD